MATARAGTHHPFGSSDWIAKEYNEISALCENELEDFTFSARNEVEWLNEHMSEIFLSNKIRLAEILKTPAKLRGKTPRTQRQRSPLKEISRPVNEVSSTDKHFDSLDQFQIRPPLEVSERPQSVVPALNKYEIENETQATFDSGYHETNDREIEVELPPSQDLERDEKSHDNTAPVELAQKTGTRSSPKDFQEEEAVAAAATTTAAAAAAAAVATAASAVESRSTEDSFHSANESQAVKPHVVEDCSFGEVKSEAFDLADKVSEQLRRESGDLKEFKKKSAKDQVENDEHKKSPQPSGVHDTAPEDSTSIKLINRKASISFAALPPRPPIATTKSMGNPRASSYIDLITNGKPWGTALLAESDPESDKIKDPKLEQSLESNPETFKIDGSKHVQVPVPLSGQSLIERIAGLGKAPTSRPTKASYQTLPDPETKPQETAQRDKSKEIELYPAEAQDERNWTSHTMSQGASSSPIFEHFDTAGENVQASKAKQEKEQTGLQNKEHHEKSCKDETSIFPADSSTKPVPGSQSSIVSSKSRLQALMQSARGLFTSSATVSAGTTEEGTSRTALAGNMDLTSVEDAANQREDIVESQTERDRLDDVDGVSREAQDAVRLPTTHKLMPGRADATRKPNMKPLKDQPIPKPVSIKIGLMPRGPLAMAHSSALQKEHEQQSKRLAAESKESRTSNATTSSNVSSHKGLGSIKAKTMFSAERKRETEEKAAQKKAIKPELKKRKAAQQDESQKREQTRQAFGRQKERERQEAEEKRRQELREADAKRRAEAQAKKEQMHKEHQSASKAPVSRHELARPESRQAMVQDFPGPTVHTSVVKQGPKRRWQPEPDEETVSSARGTAVQGDLSQQQAGKRRKTEEEEAERRQAARPAAASSKHENAIKNDLKAGILGHNYPHAPPPAPRHGSNAQQNAGMPTTLHQMPSRPPIAPSNSRFETGIIPFANPPPQPVLIAQTVSTGPLKTPLQPPSSVQASTQSHAQHQQPPQWSPIGDGGNIHLPEPPTDSEEEDSETERETKAKLPAWATSPFLNDILLKQDPIDPGSVFGPIPPLDMEDMFKGRGQRKDFRSRTSSANWHGSDKLTEDEVRKDIEAREKMKRNGGWTFEP